MLGSPSGAQRASYHRRTAIALIVASLAAITIAPIVTATTPSVDGASPTIDSASAPSPQSADTVTYSAPWLNAEKYALFLVNCTRTGGWVTRSGGCKGYGSGHYSAYRKALSYSSGISNKAARPYAKLLAVRNNCGDYYDHDPGYRMRRAGYYGSAWGENVGCGTGYSTAKSAVLAFHRMMQAEKSWKGPHWRNMKSRNYTRIGIGVWRYSGRTRLVVDFYHP